MTLSPSQRTLGMFWSVVAAELALGHGWVGCALGSGSVCVCLFTAPKVAGPIMRLVDRPATTLQYYDAYAAPIRGPEQCQLLGWVEVSSPTGLHPRP